ncbi:MAG: flavodoxin domain-containing protein [Deltaproteobacteria bacterium]|nr:flavodoxin domain-containing protein [Deltaproteobacteria bacterium]
MKRVLIAYASRTGKTEEMANYIAEGIRFSGNNAVLKKISEEKEKDLAGYDGYVFGCPTYHRGHDCGDEDIPFSGREGKSYRQDGRRFRFPTPTAASRLP